jgi:adenosylhomocysteine nucleosidase
MHNSGSRTVLMIAAEKREFSGFARKLEGLRGLDWKIDYSVEGSRDGTRFVMAANGAGSKLALVAAQCAVAHTRPDLLISAGYCGALAPHLRIGDIVACQQAGGQPGEMLGVDQVVTTAADKQRAFRQTAAAAVDMESHALARFAHERGIPFRIIRAVSDEAAEDLGLDLNRARDPEGRIRDLSVLHLALLRPWSGLPALVRLASNASFASKKLGDFLASTRFD